MASDGRAAWRSLLWRTWEAFGVSSWERGAPESVVDPEALIVATLVHGDQRLINEALDWSVEHATLVHVRRIRAMTATTTVAESIGTWLQDLQRGDGRSGKSVGRGTPLRRIPATAALRFRSLTGTTTRSEIVRAMHGIVAAGSGSMSAADLIDELGFTRAHVNRALAELTDAGFLEATGSPKRLRYAPRDGDLLSEAVWRPWAALPHAPWQAALRVGSTLVAARATLDTPGVDAVGAAVEQYRSVAKELAKLVRGWYPIEPAGPASTVGPELADVVDDALTALVALLDAPAAG